MTKQIEDYGFIGDCRTAALIDKQGSIEWFCPGRFDAPACLAALLGDHDNGYWKIAPAVPVHAVRRSYRPDTLILETEFETESGSIRLTDFMPIDGEDAAVVRILSGIEGCVPVAMELVVRFDYGRLIPWVTQEPDGVVAVAGADLLVLHSPVETRGSGLKTVATFDVEAGSTYRFVLRHGQGHLPPPAKVDVDAALEKTECFWQGWAKRCTYQGPWRDAVVRSLITLKGLSYQPTGGIVAAPTTSLPEQPGGRRNWDYRYCWLRDTTFTLLTLMEAGYRDEADAWRCWLERTVAGAPAQLQPIYGVLGERRIDEWEIDWLGGFTQAKPVRVGNSAYRQLQLDIFGEVLDALHCARRFNLASSPPIWSLQRELLDYLEAIMDRPDKGIWEFRGKPDHFTHSKVMCWVAFDRAVSAVEDFGLEGPVEHWREVRERLHDEICRRAFDAELNGFVQAYGGKTVDASSLLMAMVGFLPPEDARIAGTLEAVTSKLVRRGLVYRYDSKKSDDGLPPGEGAFIACSFWLVDNLIMQGRHDEGQWMFERLLELRNDLGLLPEEYDVARSRFLGNFPQALSHLAMINTAYNLEDPVDAGCKRGTGPIERAERARPEEDERPSRR